MRKRGRPPYPDILTPREWEVLALLREGLTNEQIADRLSITIHAARYHVSEILSKLGVSSRQQAAAWEPEKATPFWTSALAFALWPLRHIPFGMAANASVAAVAVATAAGIGFLVWGLVVTGGEDGDLAEGLAARLTATPTSRQGPGAPLAHVVTAEPTVTTVPLTLTVVAPTPFVTSTLAPDATPVSVGTPSGVASEPTSAPPSPLPSSASSTPTVLPTVAPSPRVGPLEGAEPYELAVDEAGGYYIPDRGDGCTWTQQLALTPLEGGDSPIIVLYSDCEAEFYLAYYVTQHRIGNVTKAPVYQPWPLAPVDVGLGADGKYYVPDRGDGCAYWEIARPTIGGQQWVMLRSELCHHFLWRFSLATGELFPMDPLWWPDRSAPSPSDIQVGPDGRYFIVRSDGCTWVESSRADTRVYFTTECSLAVTFAFVYDTATGEFHDVGLPP